ncbi:MAG: DnaD domain protein [Longicatena sp.]
MEKWWNEKFINRRDWILTHLGELSIDSDETMVLLLIDFMNEHRIMVNHGILANKLKKDADDIDNILSQLSAKGYLNLNFKDGSVRFEIDGVFDQGQEKAMAFNDSLFELFESEFARPLSQMELQRIADWLQTYDQKLISYALREALTYEHKNFDYIERILVEWKKRDFHVEDYEDGKR